MKRWCGMGSVVGVAAVLVATLSAPAVSAQPHIADDVSPVVVSTTVNALAPAVKSRTVSVLYATTAQRGSLTKVKGKKRTYVMTLRGASDHVTWFTDRPARQSGFLPTAGFVSSWAGYGFAEDPPNMALVMRDRSGATGTVVAVMRRPKVNSRGVLTARLRVLSVDQAQQVGGNLAVHADRHDGKVPSRFTSAALFIDNANGTYVGTSPTGCLIAPYTTCRNSNLAGADLSDVNLNGADLGGADLTGAILAGANLAGANLVGTNLTDANIEYASLSGAYLNGANLAGASLFIADLSGAYFTGASLTGANLTRANFTDANLTDADLTDADLFDANLTGANFTDANLTDANLTEVSLTGANLTGANLAGANLTGANLTDANLFIADLSGANLTGANLTGADLSGANLSAANLSGANLTGVELTDTILAGSITDGTTTCPNGNAGPCW